MRIIDSLAEAQATILHRRPLEQVALPPHVAQRIREVFGAALTAEQVVDRVIAEVRRDGDAALLRLTAAIDGVALRPSDGPPGPFAVDPDQIAAAYDQVPAALVGALRLAAQRIEEFHRRWVPRSWTDFSPAGGLGQLILP